MADDSNLENNNLENNIKRAEELKNIFTDIGSATARMNRALRKVGETASDYGGTYRSIRTSADKVADIQKESLKSAKGINKAIAEREKIESKISQLNAQIEDFHGRAAVATGTTRNLLLQQAKNLANARDNAQELKKTYEDIEKTAKVLNSKTKFFDVLSDTVKLIPGLGPLISKPFEKAAEAARKSALEGKGMLHTFSQGFKTLGTEIGSIFTASSIAKSILEASKQSKELSNSLGVGLTAANGIQKEFTKFADQTGDARLTTQGLVEAQIKLQQNLKLGTQFSGETLQNFIQLTEYLGVSEKAASKIALVQESLGDKSGEFTNNLAESAVLSAKNLGVNLPLQEVYESIGNLSTTTLLNLRRNPEALGQALAEAKKLGIELNSINKISESLLNFEQSIQSELEAEVLTGKQLNLEQARLAALKGDTLALTREVASQVGTISEFEQMNVIQRQSLAKAFGMNVDQMSEMLLKQEAMLVNEDIAAKLTAAQLRDAKDRVEAAGSLGAALKEVATEADATKNFEDAAKQLKQSFQQIVLAVEPLVTKLSKLLASFLASPLGRIAAVLGAGAALAMKALTTFRPTGLTPATAMWTREVGAGGLGGMMGGRYGVKMRASQMGKYGLSRKFGGAMGMKGVGLGMAAGIVGMGIGSLADSAGAAGKEGLAVGLDTASGALKGAGTGAMLGSVIPVIGTGVGAAVGALVGGVTSYMDAAEKRREEADRKHQEEFQNAMRTVAMREARIYMDKHEVGRSIATSNGV